MPAPVAMFAFNRPWHLNKSLKSLSLCKLSDSTDLIIFIDGPRKKSDERKISNNINIINFMAKIRKVGSVEDGIMQILKNLSEQEIFATIGKSSSQKSSISFAKSQEI